MIIILQNSFIDTSMISNNFFNYKKISLKGCFVGDILIFLIFSHGTVLK